MFVLEFDNIPEDLDLVKYGHDECIIGRELPDGSFEALQPCTMPSDQIPIGAPFYQFVPVIGSRPKAKWPILDWNKMVVTRGDIYIMQKDLLPEAITSFPKT